MKRPLALFTAAFLSCSLLTSCGSSSATQSASSTAAASSSVVSEAAESAASEAAESAVSEAAEAAESAASEAAEAAESATSEAAEAAESATSEVAEEAESAVSEAAEAAESAASEAAEAAESAASEVAEEAESAVSEAAETAESAASEATEAGESAVSEAAEAAESAVSEAEEAAESAVSEAAEATESASSEAAEAAESTADDDQAKADEMDALIEAIYVQERTEETDAQIAEAKAAWDALTDEQKELVAEADYFGRDTGDVSADDPRNADEIGENEILVVSFGTSFNDSRATDIKGIEDAIAEAFPGWQVRRAFTAQIIINHVQARDGEIIDNVDQALQRAVDNGVKNLVIQPTHLMHGAEYDELVETLDGYAGSFENVVVAEPLLGEVGSDATAINEDKEAVAVAVTAEAVAEAGYENLDAAKEDGTAFVFIGHGTSHVANVSYSQMQAQMEALGYENVFIGTVEGEPEGTECEAIIEAVKEAGYTKVVLRPLMVVAGDHANNDMADPEDPESWVSQFDASGAFEQIDVQIAGLGRIAAIEEQYVAHTQAAVDAIGGEAAEAEAGTEAAATEEAALPDGVYTAAFNTDSSMFKVNEANEGRGILTVADGQMSIHVSLVSDKIVNLYPGLAEDAQAEGAELLQPTTDEVTYSDGMTEEVYGFDIPVPSLDEEFDCALIGTKGVWYDHKVSVSDPQPYEE